MNPTTPATGFRRLIATAILSALASSFAAICPAADSKETVSQVVKYGDLDVSNPQGAAKLYGRIVAAAENVCGKRSSSFHDLYFRSSVRDCMQKAIADAVTRVDQPAVLAVYNSKHSQRLPITVASAQRR
jgi:UrcA family protein